MTLKEFDKVRIIQLLHPPEYYVGLKDLRPPKIGDIGFIVDIQNISNLQTNYVVEASSPNGIPDWLGGFVKEELEFVP